MFRAQTYFKLFSATFFSGLAVCVLYVVGATVAYAATAAQDVREAFADAPAMIEIARCESKFRQYADSGNVLRGGYGNNMVGVFQFNSLVHSKAAAALGFDIETLVGNIGYAKHIYATQGTDPWVSSFSCWQGALTAPSKASGFTNLVFGQTHPDVIDVQRRLNEAGFTIADAGPGSVGNETSMFGTLTRVALRRFQCAEEIACSGDEYSTGYGLYNEETHEALVAYKKPKTVSKKSNSSSATTPTKNKLSAAKRAAMLAQIEELTKLVAQLQKQLALKRNT